MLRFRALAAASLLSFAFPIHATWEKVYTGNVSFDRIPIYTHRGIVYIATQGGLITSADSGKTWTPSKPVLATVVSQMFSQGDTLWTGTRGKGVQFTTDDAQTWKPSNQGLTQTDVRGLIRVSGAPSAGAAGAGGGIFFAATLGGGMFRSRDDAKTWEPVNTGLPDLQLNCVAAGGGYIFAGTSTQGVYRSKDSGDHWEAANNNFNGKGSFLFAWDGGTLFSVPIDHKGVIRSADLGASWNTDTTGEGVLQFPHGLDAYVSNVYWVHDRNVNGGVQITKDGGKTWMNVNKDVDPHRIERPKSAGFGVGYMFVGSDTYGIWRRPMSELDLAPVPSTVSIDFRRVPNRERKSLGNLHVTQGLIVYPVPSPNGPAGSASAEGRLIAP